MRLSFAQRVAIHEIITDQRASIGITDLEMKHSFKAIHTCQATIYPKDMDSSNLIHHSKELEGPQSA